MCIRDSAAAQRVIREGLPALNVPAGGEDGMKEGVNLPLSLIHI